MISKSEFINAVRVDFKKFSGFFFLFLFVSIPCGLEAASAQPYERETPVVRAVRMVSSAVVNISSEYEVRERPYPFSGGGDTFFDFFFRDFFDPGFDRKYRRTSLGSGVIIDGEKGFILTNAHVIQSAGAITVMLNDEREFEAKVKGLDPESDLAVLQIESEAPLPSVGMGNSEDLMIGETVIAIGNPFGFSHTVTTGVISAVDRSVRTDDAVYHNFIQTDASINPGNSGGPLLNINGKLIGVNTAIYAKAQGIGFAIPINTAKRIVSDLIRFGEVVSVWTGIVPQSLDSRLVKYLGLPDDIEGVLVGGIEDASPAKAAGIVPGDVLLSIDGRAVKSPGSFQLLLREFASGDKIEFELLNKGKRRKVELTASVFPLEMAMDLSERLLGVRVEDVTVSNRNRYGLYADEGVVIVKVVQNSRLAEIGAMPGDVILKLDENIVKNVEDYKETIVKYRKKESVVLLLQRKNQGYYITVKL